MQCPKCRFEVPADMHYCGDCGAKLESICPICNFLNPPEFKFCGKCGYNFKKSKERSDCTEPQIINRVGSIVDTDGERKHVTILFSDLSGYTAMSEKLDPEEVKQITSRIFGEVSNIIIKYDGFVEKYIGDAVMAVFGASQSHEDDPVRAIKASMEIRDTIKSIGPEYERRIGQPLLMNTGVNTGLVVTGEINFQKGTHGISGDPINVAARLSGLSTNGEITVGLNTYRQAEGYFNFEELAPVSLKGKAKPVRVYKVLTAKEHPVKIHGLHGIKADLIGRKVEMNLLLETAHELNWGKGSLVTICGAAGTGKSRLIGDFKNSLNLDEIQWVEGHAYPYSQNTPYFTLIDLLNKTLQIEESDSPQIVRKKVEFGVSALVGDRKDIIPYIGSLFSLDYPEIENVSPEFWKAQLQKGVQVILSGLMHRKRTIICFEDLHWADPSFLELIRMLLPDIRGAILFICIYRPTISLFTSSQTRSLAIQCKEIRLRDLSPSESQVMVESLLKTDATPIELRRFVHDKIEGNPFYIEEVINSLIESETLVEGDGCWNVVKPIRASDISSTIQGVITGRLDRLEKESKRILQEASVIGRAFLYDILKKVTELKNQLDKRLNDLEQIDLIKTRTTHPDLEYVFKHALTQEVVYNGLIKKERKEIHKRIGTVIEEFFADRLAEFYETLAYHFQLGKSTSKAVTYLIKSGEKSLKRYALEEANNYYVDAFEILSNIKEKSMEEKELLVDLIIKWSYVYYYNGKQKEWNELLLSHQSVAESIKDKEKAGVFFAWIGFSFISTHNNKSKELLERALLIGEESQNEKIIAYANTWLIYLYFDLGMMDQAERCGNKVQEMSNLMESDPYLFFKSLAGLGITYWINGQTKNVFEFGKKLVEYGQEYSNIRSQTLGHMLIAFGYNLVGDFQKQCECFKKAVDVSADPFYEHIAKTYLSFGYILNNQILDAEKHLDEVVAYCDPNRANWCGEPAKMMQGIVMIAKGNMHKGLRRIKETLARFISNERKVQIAITEAVLGKIYLQIATGSEHIGFLMILKNIVFLAKNVPIAAKRAEEHLNKAINIAKEIGATGLMAQAYLDLGILHKTKKRKEQARECVDRAIELFEKSDATMFLKQANEFLFSLR